MQNLNLFAIKVDTATLDLENLVFSRVDLVEQPIKGFKKKPAFYDSKFEKRMAKLKIVGNYSKEQLNIIVAGIENKAATSSSSNSSGILADVEGLVMEGKSFEKVERWLGTTYN